MAKFGIKKVELEQIMSNLSGSVVRFSMDDESTDEGFVFEGYKKEDSEYLTSSISPDKTINFRELSDGTLFLSLKNIASVVRRLCPIAIDSEAKLSFCQIDEEDDDEEMYFMFDVFI